MPRRNIILLGLFIGIVYYTTSTDLFATLNYAFLTIIGSGVVVGVASRVRKLNWAMDKKWTVVLLLALASHLALVLWSFMSA